MPLSKTTKWIKLYDMGRLVDMLMKNGMTRKEIEKQTQIAPYLLTKAHSAYLNNNTKSQTAENNVINLKNITLQQRLPTPSTFVTNTMRTKALKCIEQARNNGITLAQICRYAHISRDAAIGTYPHMTYATYTKIMSAYNDILFDIQNNLGTKETAHKIAGPKISKTKSYRHQKWIPQIQMYLQKQPNASQTEIAQHIGIHVTTLKRIDSQYHILPKNANRLINAKTREKKVKAYLRKHPKATIKDIQELLNVPKSTAYSLMKRAKSDAT